MMYDAAYSMFVVFIYSSFVLSPCSRSVMYAIIQVGYQGRGQRGTKLSLMNQHDLYNVENGSRWKLAVTKSMIQFPAPFAVGCEMTPSEFLVPKVVS